MKPCHALRPGQRSHPDRSGSGAQQNLRCGARGGAGGHDVVDEESVLVFDCYGISDGESAAQVGAALMRREPSLALSRAEAHERARSQRELPVRMAPGENVERLARKSPRLVKAALRMLDAVQRYGNHQHLGRRLSCELCDRGGEHAAQAACRRMQPIIFEGVNRFAQPAPVEPEGYGSDKWRRSQAAGSAQNRVGGQSRRDVTDRVTAAHAGSAGKGRNRSPAEITDWNGRKPRQRRAAKSAGGG